MNGSVQIHENRLDEYVDFINTNNFTDVYINDLRYSLNHINFLERCPQIESLHISSTCITDYSSLYNLKKLKIFSTRRITSSTKLNSTRKLYKFGGTLHTVE